MATTNCYDFCWNSSINIQTVLKSLWYRFFTLHYMLKSIREYLNKIKSFRSFLATKTPSYRLLKILMRGDLVVVLLTKNFMFWIVEKLSQLQNCTDSSRSAIFYTRPSRCDGALAGRWPFARSVQNTKKRLRPTTSASASASLQPTTKEV